ncbi:MAG: TolC family outer membrane protein [Proteobacteria bacterium]|nr:TolC family outer membrane protein [Pseudomonadota bacterium]
MPQTNPFFASMLVSVSLLAAALSAPVMADDLMDVFLSAKDNDAVVGAARASYRADKERLPQALSALLPSLVASASTTKTETTTPGTTIPGGALLERGYNDNGWNAQLRQPVLNVASWFGYNSAKAFVKASSLALAAQEQDLIVRVADAYLNILRTRDRLDTTNAEVTAVKRQLEQVQQRFDVGLVAITDVLESQAAFDAALVQQIQAETAHYISFETLRTLTGRDYDELATLSEQLPIVDPDPLDEEAWVEAALRSNLAIRAAMEQLNSARNESRSRWSDHLPTVDATVTRSNNHNGNPLTQQFSPEETETTLYGLQVTMPLFQGGRTTSRSREAKARVAQAQEQLLNQRRLVVRNTRNLYKSVATDVARVKARLKAIRSAQSALEATQTGYEVGTRNIVDVLQAQQRLFDSQFAYADSRYTYLLNLLRLKQQTGLLTEPDLLEINGFMNSNAPVQRIVSMRDASG